MRAAGRTLFLVHGEGAAPLCYQFIRQVPLKLLIADQTRSTEG